jgi:hypothetical protein
MSPDQRPAIIKRAISLAPLESATVTRFRLNVQQKWLPSGKVKIRCLIFNDLQS